MTSPNQEYTRNDTKNTSSDDISTMTSSHAEYTETDDGEHMDESEDENICVDDCGSLEPGEIPHNYRTVSHLALGKYLLFK